MTSGRNYALDSLDCSRALERHSNCGQRPQSSVRLMHSTKLRTTMGMGFNRTKQSVPGSMQKRAAIQGHAHSRYQLGIVEGDKGNWDRVVRHFLISAKMGHKGSVDIIKRMSMGGLAIKEQNTEDLKGYGDAVEEMKSPDRDKAKRLGL